MPLTIHPLPLSGNRFTRAYLQRDPRALAVLGVDPYQPEEFDRRAEAIEREFPRERRERMATFLEPVGSKAQDALRRWVEEGGAMVTTGQQPGLFGGPLYTVYKTVAALALAAQLEARWQRPVVPVFWIASEDHDWDEVATVHLLTPEGRPLPVVAPPADAVPRPLAERPFGASLETAVATVTHLIVEQPFGNSLLESLADAYRPGRTPAESFRRWWAWLWRETPLCLVDAAHPALKAASRAVLRAEAERGAEHARRLRAHAYTLRAAGFRLQVGLPPHASNLMYHGPDGRERLYRRDGEWVAARSGTRLSLTELLRLIEEAPGVLSPNVLLRPIVERACLPTVAYVAGPAELAYYAQLPPLYDAFDLVLPVPVPRLSAVLVYPDTARELIQLGLRVEEALAPEPMARRCWAERNAPRSVQERLGALRRSLVAGYDDLADAARTIDPNLGAAIARLRNRALWTTTEAERSILRHWAQRQQDALRRLTRVRAVLRPLDQPQERVLSPLPFLALDGPDLLIRLRSAATWPPLA